MKKIVLFGAGKSSSYLIEYLIAQVQIKPWHLTVADNNADNIKQKLRGAPKTLAVGMDVNDEQQRASLVQSADIVISLLPPFLHKRIAEDCLKFDKNLLTASYRDEYILAMEPEIRRKGLLFLCEMGLDPGIDHMSALALVSAIHDRGGIIKSFISHCGGLVAPRSDNNPWRYKISWNPANVVMAGKAGADFLRIGEQVHLPYESLFDPSRIIQVDGLDPLCWYPNRDSLAYIDLYALHSCHTFIRTTLRYPEFCAGWSNLIQLKLTDETVFYDTDGMSLQQFFQKHFSEHGFSDWINERLTQKFQQTRDLLEKLTELLEVEEKAGADVLASLEDFMMVNKDGEIRNYDLDTIKMEAAATVAGRMQEANLIMKQLFFLGMSDDKTLINKGRCSAAGILQFILENKLKLEEGDADMVVMLHEIGYELDGQELKTTSSLIVEGEDNVHTAMAKTVGMPLGIAASLILENKINLTGLHIPVIPEIYRPVLQEMEDLGIKFIHKTV